MARIRCAIYTRKSSEEGLDQDFNSLEAQREACEAYIKSQAAEGWRLDPMRYDDGGFSGGTMERPALAQLMTAIKARQVDRIVVYKIDRLTRSLADFAKLVDDLDAVGASFVSVTQSFNTSTSMGRLTLNVLLSFAQFEREVTAERIRDKLAASKAKGLWMGGRVPTGYDPDHRSLKVNDHEAATIRRLFELYLDLGNVRTVEAQARGEGLATKRYQAKSGRILGGQPFSRGLIYRVLNNPIYIGRIPHKDRSYPGLHEPIIDMSLWERVQKRLADGPRTKGGRHRSGALSGRLSDCHGIPMARHSTNPRGKAYAYYLTGQASAYTWRIRAADIEAATAWAAIQIINRLRATDCANLSSKAEIETFEEKKRKVLGQSLTRRLDLVDAVQLGQRSIAVFLNKRSVANALSIELIDDAELGGRFEIDLVKRGHELKLVYDARTTNPDATLQRALMKSLTWKARLLAGETVTEIARADGLSVQVTARRLRLALLSPKIQMAIATGTQPLSLTLQRILETKLPLSWDGQDSLLLEQGNGFPCSATKVP